MSPNLKENIGVMVATIVLGVSLSANVYQYIAEDVRPRDAAGFDAGTAFPEIVGKRLDGSPVRLNVDNLTLLYVFSPNCQWCRRNQANLRALHAAAGGAYRFVGITLFNDRAPASYRDELVEYLSDNPFPGDVILLDPETLDPRSARDIRVTPQTLVLDARSAILQSWAGALVDAKLSAVEKYFGVRLPGVTERVD